MVVADTDDLVEFELVKLARDLRTNERKSLRSIIRILRVNHGVDVDYVTLDDWLCLRTRLSD